MEVQEDKVIVMCQDGTFVNVPRKEHDMPVIGEFVSYRMKKSPLLHWNGKLALPLVSITAILLLVIFNYPFSPTNQQAYILAIDINPSMEVVLDEDFKVLDIVGLNEDANRVIADLDVEGKNIGTAINEIVVQLIDENYLSQDTSANVTTTLIDLQETDQGGLSKDADIVKELFSESFIKNHVSGNIEVYQEKEKYYQEAKGVSLSINSYRLYQQMIENEEEVELEEAQKKPIKELNQMAEKSKEIEKHKQKESTFSQDKKEKVQETEEEYQTPLNSKGNAIEKSTKSEPSKQQIKKKENIDKPENNKKSTAEKTQKSSVKASENELVPSQNEASPNSENKNESEAKDPASSISEEKQQNQHDPSSSKQGRAKAEDTRNKEKELPQQQVNEDKSNNKK